MKALMKEQVSLREKRISDTTPEPWDDVGVHTRRARIQYLGAEKALVESAHLDERVTHKALMMADDEIAAGKLLVRKSDGANFTIQRVDGTGPRLRGGRYRYVNCLLTEVQPPTEDF